jgi:hypothetical protein
MTPAAALLAALCALSAAAQQRPSGGAPLSLALAPDPADSGKPVIWDPQFAAKPEGRESCEPAWPCRMQLLGVIRKNGAVELRGTALSW